MPGPRREGGRPPRCKLRAGPSGPLFGQRGARTDDRRALVARRREAEAGGDRPGRAALKAWCRRSNRRSTSGRPPGDAGPRRADGPALVDLPGVREQLDRRDNQGGDVRSADGGWSNAGDPLLRARLRVRESRPPRRPPCPRRVFQLLVDHDVVLSTTCPTSWPIGHPVAVDVSSTTGRGSPPGRIRVVVPVRPTPTARSARPPRRCTSTARRPGTADRGAHRSRSRRDDGPVPARAWTTVRRRELSAGRRSRARSPRTAGGG